MYRFLFLMASDYLKKWLSAKEQQLNAHRDVQERIDTDYIKGVAKGYAWSIATAIGLIPFVFFGVFLFVWAITYSVDFSEGFQAGAMFWTGLLITLLSVGGIIASIRSLKSQKLDRGRIFVQEEVEPVHRYTLDEQTLRSTSSADIVHGIREYGLARAAFPIVQGIIEGWKAPRTRAPFDSFSATPNTDPSTSGTTPGSDEIRRAI